MESCIEDLKKVECPMNWDLTALRQAVGIDRLVERLKERLEENAPEQTRKTLNILLSLSYEHYMAQKSTFEYISYLRQSEEIVEKDRWLHKYQPAALHIIYSMFAHTLLKMNLQRSMYYLKKIKSYKEMTDEERAFVLAMKASFFMTYGPSGNAEASEILTKVLELNQKEPEWWFLKGKCLARMRRLHYRSKPTAEEIFPFKKAVEMDGNCVRYLIHFARSQANLSSYLIHNKTSIDDFKVIEALNTDVESLLRKAVSMRVDSPHLICYIARSFMNLPHYFRVRNRNLTQFCVLQALRMSPSDPTVNHTVGLYCLKQGDVENAAYFLTEASNMGVCGASFDLCRLKWMECRKYNPVPDLIDIIERNDKYATSEAHCLLATYYFFAKNDLISTIEHWKKWHHSCDKESYPINSMFLGQESFDFNSVLYDEVRLELNSTRYNNPEYRIRLEEIVKIIGENRPDLQNEKPKRQRQHLVDRAQMNSKIGRAYPDTLVFLAREQKAMKKGKTRQISRIGEKEIVKKGGKPRNVSTKYNGYKRERKDEKSNNRREETRSQSSSRAQEYSNKYGEKPFWPPPRHHRSMECLNKGTNAGTENNTSTNVRSDTEKRKNEGSVMDKKKNVGSGRMLCQEFKSNLLTVKAASMESLLLAKSYEPKKVGHKPDHFQRSSSTSKWRSSSQESLSSNFSSKSERSEKRAFVNTRLSRRVSSEEVENLSRQSNIQRDNAQPSVIREVSVRPNRQSSIGENICGVRAEGPGSGLELRRANWRQDGQAGADRAPPKSSFFQSWTNRGQEGGRPSSRATSFREEHESSSFQLNKEQGDVRPLSHSSREFKGTPSVSFLSSNKRIPGDSKGLSSCSEQAADSGSHWSPSSRTFADTLTSSFFHSRNQGDRVRSSRTTSVREEGVPTSSFFRSQNKERQNESTKISRPFSEGQEDFRSRFGGREAYTPRGGSFTSGEQRNPRRHNINFREAGGALHDSLKRLDWAKK